MILPAKFRSPSRRAKKTPHHSAIEPLESRIAPATLNVTGAGALTYNAGAGIANVLTLSIAGANYSFNDTGETIVLTATAVAAGFTGGGTNTVLGPNTAATSILISLGDQSDQFTIAGATDPIQVNDGAGADSIFVTGAVNVGGALQLAADAITVSAPISGATTAILAGDTMAINSTIVAGTRVTLQPLGVTRDISLGTEVAGKLSLTDAEMDRVTAPILQIGVTVTGDIEVNAAITITNAPTLSLISGGAASATITDTAAGSIVVANLSASGMDGVTLDSAGNDVGTLAGVVTTAGGDFSFTDADDLIIGTVDGVSGIKVDNAFGALMTLRAGATTQTAGANIVGSTLQLLGAGPFTLNSVGNDLSNLTGAVTGAVSFTEANSVTVSAPTISGLSTTNSPISITTLAGDISVSSVVTSLNAGTSTVSLTAGSAGADREIRLNAGSVVTGTGGVTFTADKMSFIGSVNAGAGVATLQPFEGGTLINLGGADAANTLGLTDAEMDLVTAGVLRIGSATAGDLAVTAAIDAAGTGTLSLASGGSIVMSSPGTITETNLRLSAGSTIGMNAGPNSVGTLAATAAGSVSFSNGSTALRIGTVDGVTGLSTVNASITVLADALDLQQPVNAGTGSVFLRPVTGSTIINLGTAAGGLDLTDAELDLITAGVLQIGEFGSNPVILSSAIAPANVATLIVGGAGVGGAGSIAVQNLIIDVVESIFLTGANDVDFLAIGFSDQPGNISFADADGFSFGVPGNGFTLARSGFQTTTFNAGTAGVIFLADEALFFDIGASANQRDQIAVTGTVTLSGAVATFSASAPLPPQTNYVILSNDGTDPVVGTFAGLPEGALVMVGQSIASITYHGGDGNDVVLTRAVATPATLDVTGGVLTYTASAGAANGLTVSLSGANYTFNETGQTIMLTANAIAAGFSGDGTNTVTGPDAAVNSVSVALGDGNDTLTLQGLADPLTLINEVGDDTATIAGALNIGGALSLAAETINVNAAINNATTVALSADTMNIGAAVNATGIVTLQAVTAGRFINLGTEIAGQLSLTDAELDRVTASILRIGSATASLINIAAPVSPAGTSVLSLHSASNILDDSAGDLTIASLAFTANGVNFDSGLHHVGTMAGVANAVAGSAVNYEGAAALTVGTVDGIVGISTPQGGIELTVAGALALNAPLITGGGTLILGGAGITQTAAITQNGGGAVTITSNSAAIALENPANNFTGPVTLSNTGTAASASIADANGLILGAQVIAQNLNISALGTVTQTGAFSGSGALSFNEPGTLVLTAANSHLGATMINAGTLGGNGSVSGPLVVNGGATLAPGVGVGIFSSGGASFVSGATFFVQLNGTTAGTQHDQLNATGAVALGGATLTGTLGFAPALGDQFIIIANDGSDAVTGTFAGLAEGAIVNIGGQGFRITYAGGSGNDVALTAVRAAATLTWDGSAGGNWSNAGNWNLNLAPQDGDSLVFPAGAANLTNTNDIAGLDLAAITLGGSGYVIGGNAITLSGGIIASAAFNNGISAPVFNADITLTGDQAIQITSVTGATLGGAIALAGHTLTVAGASSGLLTLAGDVSGAGAVVKNGTCFLTFDGTQTGGTLTLTSGALFGSGTTGTLTATGGFVAPGTGNGILHVAGGATLGAASTLAVELNGTTAGTGHDQLDVTGAVTLSGGPLAVTTGFTAASGATFTILNNDGSDPVNGTFAGLAEGALVTTGGQTFRISYAGGTGNDVTLTALTFIDPDFSADFKKATFTDEDGDLVTIKSSRAMEAGEFKIIASGDGGQLAFLDLRSGSGFANANIKIKAKTPQGGNGDGFVNVGFIDASGVVLGKISVKGDLGQIDAAGAKSLTVGSLGAEGPGNQLAGASLTSDFTGKLGKLTVKTNIEGATIIGAGRIGPVTIKGSFLGGAIRAGADLGAVNVVGSITGTATAPVVISAFGKADAPAAGIDLAIASLTVGANVDRLRVLAGYDTTLAGKNADAAIGAISVTGTWSASTVLAGVAAGADGFEGTIDDAKLTGGGVRDTATIFSRIASITIKGAASGTASAGDSFGIVAEQIVKAKITGTALAFTGGERSPGDFFFAGTTGPGPGGATDFGIGESTV